MLTAHVHHLVEKIQQGTDFNHALFSTGNILVVVIQDCYVHEQQLLTDCCFILET